MLRRFCSVLSGNMMNLSRLPTAAAPRLLPLLSAHQPSVNFSALVSKTTIIPCVSINKFLGIKPIPVEQKRTVIKFSFKTGKRRTVRPVIHRYYRLAWGAWIKPRTGRHRRLYTKSPQKKLRYLQHTFFNATQSEMFDKMTNVYWRRRHHYPEDPYEPYHEREYFEITRRKPLRPEGVDYE